MPPAVVAGSHILFARYRHRALSTAFLMVVLAPGLAAKDVPLNAIVLYDGPNGAAYVQMTGVTVNGKTELRTCTPQARIDKSSYGKLGKVELKGAVSLERTAEGVLTLTKDQQSYCVVPSNLRFEGKDTFTASELAEQAVLQGTLVSVSDGAPNEVPSLKPGVRVVFVAAEDRELADFLRAQRAKSTAVWQQFLGRYASSSHATEARNSLAGLLEESGDTAFAQYQKATGAARWESLKQAQQLAEQAARTVQGYPSAVKSLGQVRVELDNFTAFERSELAAYLKAMQEQTPGYQHLMAAKGLNDRILEVNANYTPGLELQSDLIKEQTALDATLVRSESLLAAKRYDEAFLGLGAYRCFAPEVARIDSLVTAVYAFHFNRGKELSAQQDWDKAIPEFRKALDTLPDSEDARGALKDAEIQLANTRIREAAEQAAEASKALAEQKEYIDAYEVLATLPGPQRALVTSEMEELKDSYVPAAIERAQQLQEVHVPIRGRADEDAVRQAYQLLSRVGSLTDDPSIRLKRDLLSDKISSYYVAKAKSYLEKPMASGVGLGWCYLDEASRYKQNLDSVKDAMTRYESAYQLRAKLSVEVVIRDQTSRRESAGFAEQLSDAIATDLESAGSPARIVRRAPGAAPGLDPIFQLVGEINEYRVVKNPSLETLQSKYRAGILPVKNEAWLKADRDYEAAQQDTSNAQHALDQAVSSNKKKQIAAAHDVLLAAQKKADDLRTKLDAIDQTRAQDVIEPYNYTKTTIDLTGVIRMAFRIVGLNNLIEPTTSLKQESHKVYYVLENVRPEDTEGVRPQNAPPDEGAFMADLETQARDVLIKSVRDKIQRLPARVLEQARKLAQENDIESAAGWYIIYVNATPDTVSPERDEALKFLRDHFNVSPGKAAT